MIIELNKKIIGENNPAFIIAKIGTNHQGNLIIAKDLIQKAKNCGADAVQFQKRSISSILTEKDLDMPYENPNSFGKTYGKHKIALELSKEDYKELFDFSKNINICFIASGWDNKSIDFLDKLGITIFKMVSADLTNFPLLVHTAEKGKPMILSTGMADITIVSDAFNLISNYNIKIGLLQCTTTYPTNFNEINLNVLHTYKNKFPNAIIGYSGHELGIAIPPVAVSLGAKIIERYITLDRTMKGSDHAASLEPTGFAKMVRDIRHVEKALGSYEKNIQISEIPNINKLENNIVSNSETGTIFEEFCLQQETNR